MSSEGLAVLGAALQSTVPRACCRLRATAVSQADFILCLELGGSAGAPRDYLLCRLLCNITLKLVQFIFTFPVN